MTRRFLSAISTGLLCVILSSNRLIGEGTGNAAGELEGVDITYQRKTGETHYTPSDYRWPPPDIDMYPVIVRSDSGAKRLLLRVALHGVWDRKMKGFEMILDGASIHLDLNESGKATVDSKGCRPTAEVDLRGHEDLMHRIATATDIEAAYGEAKGRIAYRFVPEDRERFRRVLAIFDKGDLPPAQKPGQPAAPMKEGDYPKLASSVAPEYPRDARMKHISASVTLEAMILRDGSVGRIRVLMPAGRGCGFEEAALAAVRQWRYLPARSRASRPTSSSRSSSIFPCWDRNRMQWALTHGTALGVIRCVLESHAPGASADNCARRCPSRTGSRGRRVGPPPGLRRQGGMPWRGLHLRHVEGPEGDAPARPAGHDLEGRNDMPHRCRIGSVVSASTGEVHTVAGKFTVRKKYGPFVPGNVICVYTYLGEGLFMVWFGGRFMEQDLGFSPWGGSAGSRCEVERHCWEELDKELDMAWWVQIRNADDVTGWTREHENFDTGEK